MKKIPSVRFFVQVAVFCLLLFLSISHMKYGVEKAASIDAYCPYGAVESFLTKVISGEYLKRIWTSSFILMAITLVTTFLFGRVFCSHFCPLGAIQEWLRSFGRVLGIKKNVEIPKSVDKYLRFLKYFWLVVVVYYSYQIGDLFFRNYDPYNALMHLGNEFEEKRIAYFILGIILVLSLFVKSWWCRYACPLGAFLGLVRKISLFKIERNSDSCIDCGLCNVVCPANLDVKTCQKMTAADCTSCLNCVNDCPTKSLSARTFNQIIPGKFFIWIVIVSFFLPLSVVLLTPLWQTKAPSNITNTQGVVDVENIRGSNTLQSIIKETGISLDVFEKELGVPQDIDQTMMLKNIGSTYNLKNKEGAILETEDFREVIKNELKKN